MHTGTELGQIYDSRFPKHGDSVRSAIWEALVKNYFQKIFGDRDSILDIGCGRGEFINSIQAKTKFALDLNKNSGQYLNSDVKFLNCSAANIDQIANNAIDGAFTSNFFEHLENKSTLDKVLREIYRVLKPNGTLVCMGPNIRFIGGAYWDFYDHHLPLTEKSLCEALELAGYDVKIKVPRFLPYTTKSKLPKNAWLVNVYLKAPILWRVFGAQFLIIAKKK